MASQVVAREDQARLMRTAGAGLTSVARGLRSALRVCLATLAGRIGLGLVSVHLTLALAGPLLAPYSTTTFHYDEATKVQFAGLDGSRVTGLGLDLLPEPEYMALDIAGGKMYWVDSFTDKVQRANLDGSAVEDLVSGLNSPAGIALDVAGGKMYWTDSGSEKVQRANLDGSAVEDLVTSGLSSPFGMALDVDGGKMYWVDSGTDKVQRANLDGSAVEDLVTSGLILPRGIALDVAGGKMYWTDGGSEKVQRANLDGSAVEDLVTTDGFKALSSLDGIALDVAGGKMYWVDSGKEKTVQRANLDGSAVEDLVSSGLHPPTWHRARRGRRQNLLDGRR